LRQFVYGQSAQVGRDIDLRQKVICIFVCHQLDLVHAKLA